jgi:hypothetical protein
MVKGHGEGMYAGDALACTVFPIRPTANVHRALSTDSQTQRKRVGDSIHWMRSKRNAEGEEIEIKNVHLPVRRLRLYMGFEERLRLEHWLRS